MHKVRESILERMQLCTLRDTCNAETLAKIHIWLVHALDDGQHKRISDTKRREEMLWHDLGAEKLA